MDRSTRCELMAQLEDAQLSHLIHQIGNIDATVVTEPTVGMLMMRVFEDAHGDTFNLGEVLVTECLMRVADSQGWAMLMGSRKQGARLAATIDAALAAFPEQADSINNQLHIYAEQLEAEQRAYLAKLASTRVRFETQ